MHIKHPLSVSGRSTALEFALLEAFSEQQKQSLRQSTNQGGLNLSSFDVCFLGCSQPQRLGL